MKEQLEALNTVILNFGEGGMMIVNIILAFVMFGVALGIKPGTFKDLQKNPKSVIVGVPGRQHLELHVVALARQCGALDLDVGHLDRLCSADHPLQLLLLGYALQPGG